MIGWWLISGLALGLAVAFGAVVLRRDELGGLRRSLSERESARSRGSHAARLQYPHVDLTRCLGCGTCVRSCPEEGVLELIHGQAMVVHGARCVGHGRCAEECPTGAIAIALGDLEERRDIPALSSSFEAPGSPGLFLAGEVTGFALIRTAITHGVAVAREVARRCADEGRAVRANAWDLCIVGAGPAGLACALEAKARGLAFVVLEQERLGGTVAGYPRRKLVLTQPVELPLVGRLERSSWEKEELMGLWSRIATEQELPVHTGQVFQGLEREADGSYRVRTQAGEVFARNVCLALGRRGSPRKLGVPGEELPKVAYGLVDAQSYAGRRVLVVGGGDSAIEAALALAEQPGTEVTLSYRRHAFFRLKKRNEERIEEATRARRIHVALPSEVTRIGTGSVELALPDGNRHVLPNDDVFVLAGGEPPYPLLERCGVSFDPGDRQAPPPIVERGAGLLPALVGALAVTVAALLWTLHFRGYYALDPLARARSGWHGLLRPGAGAGLAFGVVAAGLVGANLAYLLRRAQRLGFVIGSLRRWMTAHVATGILALSFALLHAGLAPRHTVGGHALLVMVVLVATGAVGRYFYSFVPRAANGRELALDEIQQELARLSGEWEREDRDLGPRLRAEIDELVERGRWRAGFLGRVLALVRSQGALRATLARLRAGAREARLSADQTEALLGLARRAWRAALAAAHFEDVRGILATWRWLHRWAALLLVLLVAVHVAVALRFGGVLG